MGIRPLSRPDRTIIPEACEKYGIALVEFHPLWNQLSVKKWKATVTYPRTSHTIITPTAAAISPALRNIVAGMSAILITARFIPSGNKA